jgi:hypothetical protein
VADETHRHLGNGMGGGLARRRPYKMGLSGHRDATHVIRGVWRVGYKRQRVVGVLVGGTERKNGCETNWYC